jgi:hypothetical protein
MCAAYGMVKSVKGKLSVVDKIANLQVLILLIEMMLTTEPGMSE